METPERIDNLPATPETLAEPAEETNSIEELRLNQLKVENGGVCVICYCNLKNGKGCFPENCLHIFHFECLKRWSEQKNQCPLCKKVFDTIIHNIKSKTEYDRQPVQVIHRPDESTTPVDLRDIVSIPMLNSVFHRVDFLPYNSSPRRRFTYRTRFEATLEQNEAIQEFFGTRGEHDLGRLTPAAWRSYIYERNLYALPLPDATGRYRECSADFYRNNPAQTHRLIPWLNRELVVLLPHNQTSAIPQILEDMREMLCRHDMQSRTIRKYFRRYLHQKTEHFIHEFYNFAISAYDIVGYDRHVDYSARTQSTSTTTVEISDGSSDGEVIEVIEPLVSMETSGGELNLPPPVPAPTTTVVLETSGAQEENCIITDVVSSESPVQITIEPAIVENESVDDTNKHGEVVLESSSSDECEFVLALKPPHLRTPEMLSLDSASDSDCIFIPNPPEVIARCDSSTTDSEDNKPLAITKLKLKAEVDEPKPQVVTIDIKNILEPEVHIEDSSVNFGASTSQHGGTESQQPSETLAAAPRKLYFAPKRKRISSKNVFEESSSSSSSGSSSDSSSSSSDDSSNGIHKSKKKRRRIAEKNLKRQRRKSSAQNQKPLNLLPSTEEAHHTNSDSGEQPRIKSVIIVKNNSNQLYVKKNSPSSSSSSSSGS